MAKIVALKGEGRINTEKVVRKKNTKQTVKEEEQANYDRAQAKIAAGRSIPGRSVREVKIPNSISRKMLRKRGY